MSTHISRAKCLLKSCPKEVKCRSNVQRKKSVSSIFSGCFFFCSSSILRFLIWFYASVVTARQTYDGCEPFAFAYSSGLSTALRSTMGVINVNRIIYEAARREIWPPMFWRNDNIIIIYKLNFIGTTADPIIMINNKTLIIFRYLIEYE